MRELTPADAGDAVVGGSVLACGGGGWVDHGRLMGGLATTLGRPLLCDLDEIDEDALVVTVTAIGAPASPDWEIRPLDYVRALQLVQRELDRPVAAVMTAQNGSSTTLNGWIQSAVLGVRVLDAAGDVRAHPTGKLGALGLTSRPGYETVQAVAGGNRRLCGGLEVVVRGRVIATSDVLRDVCTRAGGFIAAARHPVEASWVKENAALGSISYALALGAAMRAAGSAPEAVIEAVTATTGGRIVGRGKVRRIEPLRTSGGFDHGAVAVGRCRLRYLNEYMTVDLGDKRVATYPDVIATLSLEDGRPVSIAEIGAAAGGGAGRGRGGRAGDSRREVAVLVVDRSALPLSSSTRDEYALREVETIMGVDLGSGAAAGAGGAVRVRLEPDLHRVASDLAALSEFRDPDAPGWTRRAFTPIERESRAWVAAVMAGAGLAVETDAAGNLLGTLPGTVGLEAAVVTGSHTDTVQGGGRFDGIIGVLGAIEAVRVLAENGIHLRHDLVVVDFYGEEPNDFGLSCVGSRAVAGNLDDGQLRLAGPAGATLAEALASAGGEPGEVAAAAWRPTRVHAFVELHIEQGPRLEAAGVPIGVVTGIAGIHRLLARFSGRPDHAGTTPMALRRDALLGAAEAALALERLADGGVATAGRLDSRPGAQNVVPAEADLWGEARSDDETWLDGLDRRIEEEAAAIAARRGLGLSLEWTSREPPVPVTGSVAGAIAAAARSIGIEPLELPSGAGHDAAQMARLGPMGMIFVPSLGGRSHCPEEWTDEEEVGRGIAVLAEVLRGLDAAPPPTPDLEGETVPGDSLPRTSSLLGDEHR